MSKLNDFLGAMGVSSAMPSSAVQQMAGPKPLLPQPIRYVVNDPWTHELVKKESEKPTLQKSLLNLLDGDHRSIERLAFERDPSRTQEYAGIYRAKTALVPDHLLKRISIQDSLVAAIINTRSNHLQSFGRLAKDRFSSGFEIEPDKEWMDTLQDADKEKVQDRIDEIEKSLLTCGTTKGWSETEKCSFAEYLKQSTRNALVVGRTATEVIWTADPRDPTQRKFHSFRPTDAGTIYYSAPYQEALEPVRKQARMLLEQLKNDKFTPEQYEAGQYDWVQVIDGKPFQVFTAEEMLVHNFYPVTDVDLCGYPLTPIDTTISAITTHINITTHNKLYFQSGRASRGMLIIKSNDVDPSVVNAVRQQFNASINSAANSWRMPVFGIGPDDDLQWAPIDTGGRDMEFQYLSDQNAREILAAFQMSPEELPGYQHLSRGTNNQSLSESNNEYKLEAARDVGIRPLMATFEDHINASLMPLLAPDIYKHIRFKFVGLDAETPEKEAVRTEQDMGIWMTYSDVQERVEKDPYPAAMCGKLPLNPQINQHIQNYMTFGAILEAFLGQKGAASDPNLQFYQNPFWFQWIQIQMQQQQMAAQAQAQQQQAQAEAQGQGAPDDGGGPPDSGGSGGGGPAQESGTQKKEDELGTGIDQLIEIMSKSEALERLPASKRRLREKHDKTVKAIMDEWEKDSKKVVQSLADVIKGHAKKD